MVPATSSSLTRATVVCGRFPPPGPSPRLRVVDPTAWATEVRLPAGSLYLRTASRWIARATFTLRIPSTTVYAKFRPPALLRQSLVLGTGSRAMGDRQPAHSLTVP